MSVKTSSKNQSTHYQHIIWDWNGTILNDNSAIVTTVNKLIQKNNLKEIDEQFLVMNHGHPVINLYKIMGFDLSENKYEILCDEFFESYCELSRNCDLQDGAIELINVFKQRDISQSILSAHPHEYLVYDINHKNLLNNFSEVVGSHNKEAKSKIEYGKEWLNKATHLKDKPILFIGDTDHDFETAQELGVDCVLVAKGVQHKSRLTHLDCPVFDSLVEVNEYLFRS